MIRSRLLGKDVAKKLLSRLAFAFGIGADEMIVAGTAAVQRDQVKTGNRRGVRVTIHAQDASAFAGTVKGDEIVHGPALAGIKRESRPLLRTLVKMPQS